MKKTIFQIYYFEFLAFFFCFLFIPQISAATLVKNLRLVQQNQQTQFIFELSQQPKYHMYGTPTQLVLEFQDTKLAKPITKSLTNSAYVRNIRINHLPKNRLQMMFDLKQAVAFKTLLKPDQLVVQLTALQGTTHVSSAKQKIKQVSVSTKSMQPGSAKPQLSTSAKTSLRASNSRSTIESNPRSLTAGSTENLQAAPPKPKVVLKQSKFRSRRIVIVIDPGHGGKDPGARSRDGLREKDVVLMISQELYKLLNRERGFKAVLTRNRDYFIPLRYRLKIARDAKADMFVAIHADAFKTTSRGASVYALSERGATSEAARWLAERENQSELIGGNHNAVLDQTLRSVLIDLSQTATISASLSIGASMLHYLGRISPLHYRKVEQAAFVVLKSPDIPSVLVETGFITNPYEARLLNNPHYRKQLALAIMYGIKNYYMHHPLPGTVFAVEN
jgi:N-acetylmuramoyl-L-alanine amidase